MFYLEGGDSRVHGVDRAEAEAVVETPTSHLERGALAPLVQLHLKEQKEQKKLNCSKHLASEPSPHLPLTTIGQTQGVRQ